MIIRSDEQRRELGDFLRALREKLGPAEVGLSVPGRRRTPGLRREEIAQLCGLSTTWYTWIEQGRDISVSPAALARLANVLRLGRAERLYLFDLAGKRDPQQRGSAETPISPEILSCVEAVAWPAYLLDRTWSARGWNRPAERLFAGWLDEPSEPNLLRFIFLLPAARSLICDWEARARRVTAEFRAACGAYRDDPALRRFIGDLRDESPVFAQFWDQHGVLEREGGARSFNHPVEGIVHFEQVSFDVASQPDLKLTILVPGGGVSR